jgi:hypothetical protein
VSGVFGPDTRRLTGYSDLGTPLILSKATWIRSEAMLERTTSRRYGVLRAIEFESISAIR